MVAVVTDFKEKVRRGFGFFRKAHCVHRLVNHWNNESSRIVLRDVGVGSGWTSVPAEVPCVSQLCEQTPFQVTPANWPMKTRVSTQTPPCVTHTVTLSMALPVSHSLFFSKSLFVFISFSLLFTLYQYQSSLPLSLPLSPYLPLLPLFSLFPTSAGSVLCRFHTPECSYGSLLVF